MPAELAPSPNAEYLRHEAKQLLRRCQAGDAAAMQLIGAAHPGLAGRSAFKLSDAQLVVARHYGFGTWVQLMTHVEATVAIGAIDQARVPDRRYRAELAQRRGLPPVGASGTSRHGLRYQVVDHTFAMTIATLARTGDRVPHLHIDELLPVIGFAGLSPRLRHFLAEVDACTSKELIFLDTLPALHPSTAMENVHQVLATQDPRCLVFHLDAANLHETALAHELGHVWLECVEDIEDDRVPRSFADRRLVFQFQCIQSFALDLRVNALLQSRGFDLSPIDRDYAESVRNIAEHCARGRRPRTGRAAAGLVPVLATVLLEHARWSPELRAGLPDHLASIQRGMPEVYAAAEAFVASVGRHGTADRAAIRRIVDECARISFGATGDDFDLERDLVEMRPREWMHDKFPAFLPGVPVEAKLRLRRAIAKRGLGPRVQMRMEQPAPASLVITVVDATDVAKPPLYCHVPLDLDAPRIPPEIAIWEPLSAPTARRYMPGLGLWLSRAGFEMQAAGEQQYVYAFNSPVALNDPSGLAPPKPGEWVTGKGSFYESKGNCTACLMCFNTNSAYAAVLGIGKEQGWRCWDEIECCRTDDPKNCVTVVINDTGSQPDRLIDFSEGFATARGFIPKKKGVAEIKCRRLRHLSEAEKKERRAGHDCNGSGQCTKDGKRQRDCGGLLPE